MCCTKEGIIIFIKFYNYAQDNDIHNVMNIIRHKIMIFIML